MHYTTGSHSHISLYASGGGGYQCGHADACQDILEGYGEYSLICPHTEEFEVRIGQEVAPGNSAFTFTGVSVEIATINGYFLLHFLHLIDYRRCLFYI